LLADEQTLRTSLGHCPPKSNLSAASTRISLHNHERVKGAVMMRLRTLGASVGAVAVLASACASGTTNSSSTTATNAPSAAAAASANPTQVTVKMNEFGLALSTQTFAPGTYSFVASNVGHTVHALEINGPGVSDQKTPSVAAGQSATLTVTLQAGSYEFYCPVDSHKEKGMDTRITVGGSATTTAPTTTAPTTTKGGGSGY
jgi:uncharacterized cupredoxin-like copper-binding protein